MTAKSRAAFAFPERLLDLNRSAGRLGPLLAWAVVFADIGTSVYYVPGLLFTELGGRTPSPAAAFVLITGLAVILLALKYVDVSARYPDGGGVVSVATDAFSPTVGCVGGILICISYFLTAAISAVSGLQYLAGLFPVLDHWVVSGASLAIILLGMLNYVGVRESAILTAVLALASFGVNVVLLTVVSVKLDAAQWSLVLDQFKAASALPPWPLLVGFSGSWLAYSGLESISQIAPALRPPREKTAMRAMILVMGAILLTSPLATALETALLRANEVNPDRFMFELGAAFGPRSLQLAIVATAAALLLGAANTALIGCYHVFLALVRLGYLPHWLSGRSQKFNTPHRAIAISVLAPVAVVAASRAQLGILGHIYTFGLLGAFTLTSVGLDKVKWQERVRGIGFYFGIVTSVLVVSAWGINLVHRRFATVLGMAATALGCAYAIAVKKGWLGAARTGFVAAEDAETRRHRDGLGGRDPDRRRGDPDARDVPVDDAGRAAVGEPARLPGGARARARLRRERRLPDLRRRDPGPLLPAQHRPFARGARGADDRRRVLQGGGDGRRPDLAYGARRGRVAGGRGAAAGRRGGAARHVPAWRRLAPPPWQRPPLPGPRAPRGHARLDRQLGGSSRRSATGS